MGAFALIKESLFQQLKTKPDVTNERMEYLILMGRLLHEVAAIAAGVSSQELEVIQKVLLRQTSMTEAEWEYVERILKEVYPRNHDLRSLTAEFNSSANYEQRLELFEGLMKVASADGVIEKVELEKIRWIARYLWITPADFNQIKDKYRDKLEL